MLQSFMAWSLINLHQPAFCVGILSKNIQNSETSLQALFPSPHPPPLRELACRLVAKWHSYYVIIIMYLTWHGLVPSTVRFVSRVGGWGGGRDLNFPLPFPCTSGSRPSRCRSRPSRCSSRLSIVKYYAMLRSFSVLLPVPKFKWRLGTSF